MPSDDEFLRAFFGLTLANSEFRHRDPLRLGWFAVRRHGDGAAELDKNPRCGTGAARGCSDLRRELPGKTPTW